MRIRDTLHFWGLALFVLPGVLGDNWGVWYPVNPICAGRKSIVIIPCQYTYPNKNMMVENVMWCKDERCPDTIYAYHSNKTKIAQEFKGRVNYQGDKQKKCDIMIKDIRDEDFGHYTFRFEANGVNKWTGIPGVEVTELKVEMNPSKRPIKEKDHVTLTCDTKKCSQNQSEFIFLKNKQLFPGSSPRLEFNSVSHQHSGNYSCALKNDIRISSTQIILDVQHAPQNTTVSVSPSAEIEEGTLVTLTCSSDANPAVLSYTWFKNNRTVPAEIDEGRIYTIRNSSSGDSGQYHCMVQNEHGADISAVVILTVSAKHHSKLLMALILAIVLTVLAVALVAIVYFKRRNGEGQTDSSIKEAQAANTTEPQVPHPADQGPNLSSQEEEEVSYASIQFKKKQPKRSAQRQDQPEDDSTIYSKLR